MAKVEINSEFCKGCLFCVKFCPKNVLEAGDKTNEKGNKYVVAVRPDDCIGCKMCATICPDAAITLYK